MGYVRFWMAEHHNMPGTASAATALAISHVAAGTRTIRVGAGGVMLPNHSPLVIAEQFGTLAALYPGRIDLGVGRAPGGDLQTMRALRRSPSSAESFPSDVVELPDAVCARTSRTNAPRSSRRRNGSSFVDIGIKLVRCATGSSPRFAFRFCFSFCPFRHACCDRNLSATFLPFEAVPAAVGGVEPQHHRR